MEQFNLVIKYRKDTVTKLENIFSRSPILKITSLRATMHMDTFIYEAYKEEYAQMMTLIECIEINKVNMNKQMLVTIFKMNYFIIWGSFVCPKNK